jgi:hypothetical protein
MTMTLRARLALTAATLLAVCAVVWLWNFVTVGRPAGAAVAADPRNAGTVVNARFGGYVKPGVLAPSGRPQRLCRACLRTAVTSCRPGKPAGALVQLPEIGVRHCGDDRRPLRENVEASGARLPARDAAKPAAEDGRRSTHGPQLSPDRWSARGAPASSQAGPWHLLLPTRR